MAILFKLFSKNSLECNILFHSLAQSAQIMLAAAVTFTYPLQFYCAMDFTWPTVKDFMEKKIPNLSGLIGEYVYRVFMVLITSKSRNLYIFILYCIDFVYSDVALRHIA
jgi:hypothetical protein